ncbi:MAG: methyltransferase regulatory domain-containing protein [Nitrosomonas sp.]|nr:MAG: methyltransferase regulatory domain-containing protein [Nitrosomonas sp.]
MSDWSAGYVTDVGYTFGYYTELSPLRIKQIFAYAGLKYPEVGTACELGFGQGMSVNLHAAASAVEWHGTDFNPAQAGFAQELAAVSGSGAKLFDDAFASFAARTDLPDFDYIGVHGIWSWINDENRAVIVDFVRRKLKVGGVLYISYNTLPGWTGISPMRHLLTEHADTMGSEGHGIINRIDGSIAFLEKMLGLNPAFASASPQIGPRTQKIKEQNRQYLAHEYFNRDWHPMYFSAMTDWLSAAKLTFACSANHLDHIGVINLTGEQIQFLKEITDAGFRETVRDFMVNQQFRRDYWVKGARKIPAPEQVELTRNQRVVLIIPRADAVLKVSGGLSEAQLNEPIYNAILDFLSDYKAKSIRQIEQAVQSKGINLAQVAQACMILAGTGQVAVAQNESDYAKVKKSTDKLNAYLINKALHNGEISYLASPVTGGGIAVGRAQQLFLLAVQQQKKQPREWAQLAWQVLDGQGQKILKSGKALETAEENIQELTEQAIVFMEKQLPILRALHVI